MSPVAFFAHVETNKGCLSPTSSYLSDYRFAHFLLNITSDDFGALNREYSYMCRPDPACSVPFRRACLTFVRFFHFAERRGSALAFTTQSGFCYTASSLENITLIVMRYGMPEGNGHEAT